MYGSAKENYNELQGLVNTLARVQHREREPSGTRPARLQGACNLTLFRAIRCRQTLTSSKN